MGGRGSAGKAEADPRAIQHAEADVRTAQYAVEDHEEWREEHGPDTADEARVRAVYEKLGAKDPDAHISFATAMKDLPGLSQADFQAAMLGISLDPDVIISPNVDQSSITPADKAAAIIIGGKAYHQAKVKDSAAVLAAAVKKLDALKN